MRPLLENLNALVVLAGFTSLVLGVAVRFSWPAAAIVAGLLIMAAGLYPYLRPMRKG
jgi:hypothetical protein